MKYNEWMDAKFASKLWICFNQPPQSPVTNVHDSCIFPMLSKCVSREQAIKYKSRLLVGNQIRDCVLQTYFDERNLRAMSRAFAANHQIALAILHHKGDNNYLRDRGGMSFGVRRTFVNDPDGGKGVVVFDCAPTDESETNVGRMRRSITGLKYKMPDVTTSPDGFDAPGTDLPEQMKKILKYDFNRFVALADEESEFWNNKFAAHNNEQDEVVNISVYDNDFRNHSGEEEEYNISEDDDDSSNNNIDDDDEDVFINGQPPEPDPYSIPVYDCVAPRHHSNSSSTTTTTRRTNAPSTSTNNIGDHHNHHTTTTIDSSSILEFTAI